MQNLFSDDFEQIFEKGIVPDGMSISWLMSQLNLSGIAKILEHENYSPNLQHHFHYPVEFMIKLIVVVIYRRIPFRYIRVKLTEEDRKYLLPKDANYDIPAPSTLHHFMKYRLGTEGLQNLMMLIASEIMKYLKDEKNALVDSTPLAGAPHSEACRFNPHYNMKMDKAHILHLGNYPLFMLHSNGVENDMKYGRELIEIAHIIGIKPERVLMDKGYDSYEMHTLIFEKLDATPIIQLRVSAVIAKVASDDKIKFWCNKYWKKGGNNCKTIREKLHFLTKTDKRDLVGQYLRNYNLEHKEENEEFYRKRSDCERKNAHIKQTVKFDVVGYRDDSHALYSYVHFIVFQLMNLAHLQNRFQNPTSLAGYR